MYAKEKACGASASEETSSLWAYAVSRYHPRVKLSTITEGVIIITFFTLTNYTKRTCDTFNPCISNSTDSLLSSSDGVRGSSAGGGGGGSAPFSSPVRK